MKALDRLIDRIVDRVLDRIEARRQRLRIDKRTLYLAAEHGRRHAQARRGARQVG